MEDLEIKFMDTIKDKSAGTIKMYVRNYTTMKHEVKDFTDVDKLKEVLMHRKPQSRHSYVWPVIHCLRGDPEKYKEALEMLQEMHVECRKATDDYYREQKKSIKQSDNWISYKDLQKYNKRLKRVITASTDNFKMQPKYYELRDWYITCLYVLDPEHPPMRCDYNLILGDKNTEIDKKNNYLIIHNKSKKEFHFYNYKRHKTNGDLIIPLSKKMNAATNIYLKYLGDSKWLFPTKNGTNSTTTHFQKMVQNAFKGTGKNLGVCMLRNIFITDNVDFGGKLKDKYEIAQKMGHTVQAQENYKKFDE